MNELVFRRLSDRSGGAGLSGAKEAPGFGLSLSNPGHPSINAMETIRNSAAWCLNSGHVFNEAARCLVIAPAAKTDNHAGGVLAFVAPQLADRLA